MAPSCLSYLPRILICGLGVSESPSLSLIFKLIEPPYCQLSQQTVTINPTGKVQFYIYFESI